MARHLSVATVIEKNRIASVNAFIVLMEVDVVDRAGVMVETLYLARNTENLTFQGQEYVASNFEITLKTESGTIPEIQVVAQDQTRAIQQRMEEHGGGVGFTVRVMIINTGNMTQPPEVAEEFKVVRASAAGYAVTFGLGAENPLSMRFPRGRQAKDRCRFLYKGVECGYTGPMLRCDLTLQGQYGCAAHGNTRRFGGFPGINARR